MKILITDGRSLAALAAIRSLGNDGHTIHCGESFKQNLSTYSKYVDKRVTYPDPEDSPEKFIQYLLAICRQEKYDLIIPVRDDTTISISKHQDKFLDVTNVYIADYGILSSLMDKGKTVKIAQRADVPTPDTWFPEDTSRVKIKDQVEYPILVRPRRSSGSRGIRYVNNANEFDQAFEAVSDEYGLPIIQEYISHQGGHYSIGTLFNSESEEIATHVYKETKQYPTSGGPAINAISVEKPNWTDSILQILKSVGWTGPAHMDVLYDPKSEEPKLLEVNPRLWMSIQIAISAGVDFPVKIVNQIQGNSMEPTSEYETGIVYRWVLPNEILWLLNSDDKLEAIREFIQFDRKSQCYGSLSFQDPTATIGVLAQGLRFLTEKSKREKIFNRGW